MSWRASIAAMSCQSTSSAAVLVLAAALGVADAHAEPPAKPAAPALKHGSGAGDGDSRGAGDGDGRGRRGAGVDHGSQQGVGDALGDGPGSGRGRKPLKTPPPPKDAGAAPPASTSPLAIQVNEDFLLVPSISYQMRSYHREGNDFVAGGVQNFLRHRARVGLAAQYRSLAEVFIQLQDVRTFGEEGDPAGDFSADSFDLHQGYLTLTPTADVRLRLGRQEVVLANERLVGRPLFLEQSRSFDGMHLRYDKAVELEAGYFLVRDYSVGPEQEGLPNGKRHLGIGHLGYEVIKPFHPHVLTVLDADTAIDRLVVTAGGLITGSVGGVLVLSYAAEGYYQAGHEGTSNVSAWLAEFSTRVTSSHESAPFAEVRATMVSGDDKPDDPTAKTFSSPFPRGHRIHGEMDFFINFPRDTDGRGLRDFGGRIGWAPKKVALTAAFHFFDAMAARPDGLRHFGFESDFRISYPFWEYAYIDTFYGFFVPGEIKRAGLVDPGIEHFVYATSRVRF